MKIRRLASTILFCGMAAPAFAVTLDANLPHYEPAALEAPTHSGFVTPDGAITIVGYNDMREILTRQAALFSADHPGIRIHLDLPGTRFAPAALAREQSALAPMGAEFTPQQLADYRAVTGSDPIGFRVAHASLKPQALSGPLAIFVHHDNPLAMLTLDQLALVYTGQARHWGDLGLQGAWAARPIHLYGLEASTPLALFMQEAGLHGKPFIDGITVFHQSADVAKHVSDDPMAIGFAAAMRATPSLRALPLAEHAGQAAVAPTEGNLTSGRYPLDRYLMIYARAPLTPFAQEFLRFVLSREGQEAIAASPQGYLPLSAEEAAGERIKLQ